MECETVEDFVARGGVIKELRVKNSRTPGIKKIKSKVKRRVKYLEKLKNGSSKIFYESKEWNNLCSDFLRYNKNVCCKCGETKNHNRNLIVEHIKPRNKFPELSLEISNLEIYCKKCLEEKMEVDYKYLENVGNIDFQFAYKGDLNLDDSQY